MSDTPVLSKCSNQMEGKEEPGFYAGHANIYWDSWKSFCTEEKTS